MTAAEIYATRIDAVHAQRARLHGAPPPSDPWEGPVARRFRADPHRPLDANLAVLASYTRPEDVLLDVGGGAGRVALPLALRDRKSTRLNSSHDQISYAVFCLKKKNDFLKHPMRADAV